MIMTLQYLDKYLMKNTYKNGVFKMKQKLDRYEANDNFPVGICPICQSDNINFGDSELIKDDLYYRCDCNECQAVFKEWYKVTYIGMTE